MKVSKLVLVMGAISALLLAGFLFRDRLFHGNGVVAPTMASPEPTGQVGARENDTPLAATAPIRGAERADEQARPAWMTDAKPVLSAPVGPVANKEINARMAQMRGVMERLEKLQSQQNPDLKELDAALADVERIHGSSELQGLRLDALRDNLKVAARMQKAAEEMKAIQQRQSTGGGTPEQQAELNRKLAEIQALQSELRQDFYVGKPGAKGP